LFIRQTERGGRGLTRIIGEGGLFCSTRGQRSQRQARVLGPCQLEGGLDASLREVLSGFTWLAYLSLIEGGIRRLGIEKIEDDVDSPFPGKKGGIFQNANCRIYQGRSSAVRSKLSSQKVGETITGQVIFLSNEDGGYTGGDQAGEAR